MKNKIVIILLAVLLIVPSIVAVINYNMQQGGEVSSSNAVSMSLTDPLGNTYNFLREGSDAEKDMIDYFVSVKSSAEEVAALPSAIESLDYCSLNVNTTASEAAYKFYFTKNVEDCYYVDGNGKTYRISEKDAEYFHCSPYSAFLYENGIAPTLKVTGKNILPDAASWSFMNAKEEYVNAAVAVSSEVEKVKLEGGIAMEFTNKPDAFNVKLTDKSTGEVVFEDAYDKIASVTINDDMAVTVEVSAKWYEDKTRNYYGELAYKFEASLSAPAEFYAGTNTIQVGEFVCISAYNVTEVDNISFSCEPAIDYTPKFFLQEDGVAYALIPFNGTLATGQYTLSFSYGGASQKVNIELTDRDNPFRNRERTYPAAIIEAYYTDEIIAKTEETLRPIAQASVENIYFDGEFVEACSGNGVTLSSGYGHTISLKGTDISFVHSGVDYAAATGTAVVAGNAGEVVYAGYLDHTGYIVVIDHGLGLKSWYAHMGKVSVQVGDIVKKGDAIGECGGSGFASESGVHVGYTVFETSVCQYTLWPDGINKGIPVYKAE
ncbi:MAG: M23 family metallopeptidase [Clostridia bacterium]|nr:M23 family metallopeptidase [Clostridia bacterium]